MLTEHKKKISVSQGVTGLLNTSSTKRNSVRSQSNVSVELTNSNFALNIVNTALKVSLPAARLQFNFFFFYRVTNTSLAANLLH